MSDDSTARDFFNALEGALGAGEEEAFRAFWTPSGQEMAKMILAQNAQFDLEFAQETLEVHAEGAAAIAEIRAKKPDSGDVLGAIFVLMVRGDEGWRATTVTERREEAEAQLPRGGAVCASLEDLLEALSSTEDRERFLSLWEDAEIGEGVYRQAHGSWRIAAQHDQAVWTEDRALAAVPADIVVGEDRVVDQVVVVCREHGDGWRAAMLEETLGSFERAAQKRGFGEAAMAAITEALERI